MYTTTLTLYTDIVPCLCFFFLPSAYPQTDTVQLYKTQPDSCTHILIEQALSRLSFRNKNSSHCHLEIVQGLSFVQRKQQTQISVLLRLEQRPLVCSRHPMSLRKRVDCSWIVKIMWQSLSEGKNWRKVPKFSTCRWLDGGLLSTLGFNCVCWHLIFRERSRYENNLTLGVNDGENQDRGNTDLISHEQFARLQP